MKQIRSIIAVLLCFGFLSLIAACDSQSPSTQQDVSEQAADHAVQTDVGSSQDSAMEEAEDESVQEDTGVEMDSSTDESGEDIGDDTAEEDTSEDEV